MKERGMIFNAEMVRAVLEGRKTQTRRIMKNQPEPSKTREGDFWFSCNKTLSMVHVSDFIPGNCANLPDAHEYFSMCCPFGAVGDRLWVRETFATLCNEDGCAIDWDDNLVKGGGADSARIYRASCEQRAGDYGLWSIPDEAFWKPRTENLKYEGTWVPSIHMPRWASRITLEITGVRVERLASISNEDAAKEGYPADPAPYGGKMDQWLWFRQMWDGIYPDQSFKVNPWVWVIEFKCVEE